jgi:hypothetical protein
MVMNYKNLNYKIVIAVLIAFLLGYLSNCNQCEKPIQDKVIKKKIEERKEEVKIIEARTEIKRAKLKPLKRINTDLTAKIIQAKERKDTVTIIVTQDSLIEVQKLQIKTLESVVLMQDKTILGLKDIIEFQEIEVNSLKSDLVDKNNDLKKLKRRKNLTIFGWIATTVGLIYILK